MQWNIYVLTILVLLVFTSGKSSARRLNAYRQRNACFARFECNTQLLRDAWWPYNVQKPAKHNVSGAISYDCILLQQGGIFYKRYHLVKKMVTHIEARSDRTFKVEMQAVAIALWFRHFNSIVAQSYLHLHSLRSSY